MATIQPFAAYRYAPKAGDPSRLLTQPYDKISSEMKARYLAANPFNLVRVILGEYQSAARLLDDWVRDGILVRDPAPALYAYFQDFEDPDSRERFTRKGFIGLGKIEDYSAGVVHRHEQTLSGPKQDRLELLRATRSHFGQIFMLYPDPEAAVDATLDRAAEGAPALDTLDEYGARHRVWPISGSSAIGIIQVLMDPKKLLIADGHHRYETALAYRDENPGMAAAQSVMMTFVNMHSRGLKILATHRVLRGLDGFDAARFFERAVAKGWSAAACASPAALKDRMSARHPGLVQIGVIARGESRLLQRRRADGELDVPVLHRELSSGLLGIGEEAVRDEKHIQYVRGMDAAAAEARDGGAQIAFLLEPTPIEDMARIAFAGGVMPQKSTDFYPKLLSGVTIYRL